MTLLLNFLTPVVNRALYRSPLYRHTLTGASLWNEKRFSSENRTCGWKMFLTLFLFLMPMGCTWVQFVVTFAFANANLFFMLAGLNQGTLAALWLFNPICLSTLSGAMKGGPRGRKCSKPLYGPTRNKFGQPHHSPLRPGKHCLLLELVQVGGQHPGTHGRVLSHKHVQVPASQRVT